MPKSSSMVSTRAEAQFARDVDQRILASPPTLAVTRTWPGVDWRTYTRAVRSRWSAVIFARIVLLLIMVGGHRAGEQQIGERPHQLLCDLRRQNDRRYLALERRSEERRVGKECRARRW